MTEPLDLREIERGWDDEPCGDVRALLAALRAHRKALQELNVESDFRNPRIDAVLATVRDEDWQSACEGHPVNPDIRAALERITQTVEHDRHCRSWRRWAGVGGGLIPLPCDCDRSARRLDALAEAVERYGRELVRVAFTLTWTHEEWPEHGPSPKEEREIREQAMDTAVQALAPRSEP